MTGIQPKGRPAWERTVDHTHYDGDPNKENYLSVGVVDPLTDVGAEGFSRMTADLSAAVRVSPFCELEIQCNDSGTPAAPTIERAYLMTQVRMTSYEGDDAPSGLPSAARNGDGDITITFASTYADEYSVSGTFAVQCPQASLANAAGFVTYEKLTATTVRLRAYAPDGTTPLDDALIRFSCLSGS